MENEKECILENDKFEREVNDHPTILKKPLIITTEKWNSILRHTTKDKEMKDQTEEEKKYREYLKEGSRNLTKTWPNAIEKSSTFSAEAVDKKKKEHMERIKEGELAFKNALEKDEKKRQEQIEKAQNMLQKMKPGPRDLESAAVLCEVLKGREVQQNINEEFKKKLQEHEQKQELKIQAQAIPWIEEDQKRIIEKYERTDEYKKDLFATIKKEEQRKYENAKWQAEVEKAIREQADEELKTQIERERAFLIRKREIQRRNALEAMKMVEQRRLRDKFENEIDNKICAIVTNGKRCINKIKMEKERIVLDEKIRLQELNAKKVFEKNTVDPMIEEKRMQKAIEQENLKFDQQERNRIQKEKMLKAERIKAFIEEKNRQKNEKAQEREKLRWDMANRLKNEEINADYEKRKTEEIIKKNIEFRSSLNEQIKEKHHLDQKQKEIDKKCVTVSNEKRDDEFFMNYASKLIKDAQNKSRPTLPLIKAVEKYKKDNEICPIKKEPKHLKSNVPIPNNNNKLKQGIREKYSSGAQSTIIKYNLNELKQLNPRQAHKPIWATQ